MVFLCIRVCLFILYYAILSQSLTVIVIIMSLSLSFVLFNNAWSQNEHLASNMIIILTSSYLLRQLLLHILPLSMVR